MFTGLIFGMVAGLAVGAVNVPTSNYPMTARVNQIDQENDIVSCIMNDNGTESIYDDAIVSVCYGGRFSDFVTD